MKLLLIIKLGVLGVIDVLCSVVKGVVFPVFLRLCDILAETKKPDDRIGSAVRSWRRVYEDDLILFDEEVSARTSIDDDDD